MRPTPKGIIVNKVKYAIGYIIGFIQGTIVGIKNGFVIGMKQK